MGDAFFGIGVAAFLVGLVVFPLMCGVLAKDKGRGVGKWAVLGFFGGPLVLWFLHMLSSRRA